MRLRIRYKLFIALLTAITLAIIVVLALTRWSFNRGFLDYVNAFEMQRIDAIADELAVIWKDSGSFEELRKDRRRWHELTDAQGPRGRPGTRQSGGPRDGSFDPNKTRRGRPGPDSGPRPGSGPGPGRGPGPGMSQPVALLDADQNVIFGRPDAREGSLIRAIEVDGRNVGYLRYVPILAVTDLDEVADRNFVSQQRDAIYIIAGLTLAIAGLLAVWLSQQLVAPLKALTIGARAIAAGKLEQRINITSQDELGQLAGDFNAMAATLESNREAQRRWIIDIAHELRTPLSILRGELQAIEDGVRDWNDDACNSLQAEVGRLERLVNDLRELTLSDAGGLDYQYQHIDLREVAQEALERSSGRLGECDLSIELTASDSDLHLTGDPERLQQLITNLIENSCRYTDAGGRIRVTLTDGSRLGLIIEDSAPGVPAAAMPRLFDRLYRVEESRNRESGGFGLGLSICKGIVAAHGGNISATPSELGGLRIEIELPRERT